MLHSDEDICLSDRVLLSRQLLVFDQQTEVDVTVKYLFRGSKLSQDFEVLILHDIGQNCRTFPQTVSR